MSRFITAFVAIFILVLASATASAQSLPMPGRGEILELRRDDPRSQEGYRSFMFGPYAHGMPGLSDALARVNADLEGDEHVTMEQLEAANPCLIIYHRSSGGNRHNGSCETNPTDERVTYASFCGEPGSCARWPMTGGTVYRIPSRPRLTPGERVEEMVRRLDATTVTETVPAPAELGGWLTELSDNMDDEDVNQRPTYEQVQSGIAAIGRTLTRAETASTGADAHEASDPVATGDAHTDMTFTEDDVPGASATDTTPRMTSAEDGETPVSPTSAGDATSLATNPYILWLIIAILSVALILLLLLDKIRAWFRPMSSEYDNPLSETEPAPSGPNKDEARKNELLESLQTNWKDFYSKVKRNDPLTEENLFLFFQAADSNRSLVAQQQKKIDELGVARTAIPLAPPAPEIVYRESEETKQRVRELEGKLRQAEGAKSDAEAKVIDLGRDHAAELALKEEELAGAKSLAKAAEDRLEEIQAQAEKALREFHDKFFVNLGLGIRSATCLPDESQPSMLKALEIFQRLGECFSDIENGVYNQLCALFAPDLAFAVPGGTPPFMEAPAPAPVVRKAAGSEDSWEGTLDESVPNLESSSTSASISVPGFGGLAALEEPASIPPGTDDSSIPPAERLSLVGESTNPGVKAPEPPPADPAGEDNETFRLSRHAPPPNPKKDADATVQVRGKKGKRRGRDRISTQSLERQAVTDETRVIAPTPAPVEPAASEVEAKEPRDDEKTGLYDGAAMELRRLEARSGKTRPPDFSAAAHDQSPVPGSIPIPRAPIVEPVAENGDEPDPTEVGSSSGQPEPEGPASLSIFDDIGSSGETGVTVKRQVGGS